MQVKKRVVYAFAHAGANVNTYIPWVNLANSDDALIFCPIERPGRGRLSSEPEENDLSELIAFLAREVYQDYLCKQQQGYSEWATFGHSFGGVISAAVAQKLTESYQMKPAVSVISGSVAPCVQKPEYLNILSDEEILQKLRADQGTPEAILNEPLLVTPIIRQLRNDYVLKGQFEEVACLQLHHPVVLISARDDVDIPLNKIEAWQRHCKFPTTTIEIDGGHFAIYQNWAEVRQALSAHYLEADTLPQSITRSETYDYAMR